MATINVCIDCYAVSANGTDGIEELIVNAEALMSADIVALVAEEDTQPHFSMSPCDVCRDRLGGDRIEVTPVKGAPCSQ